MVKGRGGWRTGAVISIVPQVVRLLKPVETANGATGVPLGAFHVGKACGGEARQVLDAVLNAIGVTKAVCGQHALEPVGQRLRPPRDGGKKAHWAGD